MKLEEEEDVKFIRFVLFRCKAIEKGTSCSTQCLRVLLYTINPVNTYPIGSR